MMDVIMIATLLVCFVLVKLFTDWCESQVEPKKKSKKQPFGKEEIIMIVLGLIILALAIYLVYALVYPEKL